MPLGHAPPESTRGDVFVGHDVDRFALPLLRTRRFSLSLSYSVFLALAVLIGVVVNVTRQPGNADLPTVALFASLAWVSGWLVQSLAYSVVAWGSGHRIRSVTIGVLGIETVPQRWHARVAFVTGVSALMGSVLLGCFFRLVDGGFQVPIMEVPSDPIWQLPSIGLGEVESVWRTASWLCFVQAIGQMCPLPRTLGRQMLAACVSLFGSRLGVVGQVKVLRLLIDSVAFCTLGLGIWLMSTGQDIAGAGWSLLMCLSVLLWVSSRWSDTSQILEGLDVPRRDQQQEIRRSVWSIVAGRVSRWREVRRVRHAHRVEHGEAVDAQRVDEILNRLHGEGIKSLNAEDRQLLEKVSANLRKQRLAESDSV
jgi:hypothetical protein